MSVERKSSNKSLTVGVIVLVIIMSLIILLVLVLTNHSETLISTDTKSGSMSSLLCSTDSLDDAFFSSDAVQRYEHDITVLFINDRFKEASYMYEGACKTNAIAENTMAVMHADYNKYMGSNDVFQEVLNPVFSTDNTRAKISLYLEPKALSKVTANIFYIDDDILTNMEKSTRDDFERMYRKKGFTCKVHD